MKKDKKISNIAASVKSVLNNHAKLHQQDFTKVLSRYINERTLYRISVSNFSDRFIVKGGILLNMWIGANERPTKDIDLLGLIPKDRENISEIFLKILSTEIEEDDGLQFDLNSLEVHSITETNKYEGVRVNCYANLGNAKSKLQVDIGFGDKVQITSKLKLPTLLNQTAPIVLAYTPNFIIAEKFEAMVHLGLINSRMKDFYDIYFLSKNLEFDGESLKNALETTFICRKTFVPKELPVALTPEFFNLQNKKTQWKAFLNRIRYGGEDLSFQDVCNSIKNFIQPVCEAINQTHEFNFIWNFDDSWKKRS